MEPKDFATQEADKEWQRRLLSFTTSMCELVYWDHEPLKKALEYQATLQQENSRLRARVAELESQLTQRALDETTLCPECGVEQIVTHLPTCAHYVPSRQ